MSTTSTQDTNFLNSVIGNGLLESAIDWIKDNIDPQEVFGEKELLSWASNYSPEEVFSESTLETWAESNGYTKE